MKISPLIIAVFGFLCCPSALFPAASLTPPPDFSAAEKQVQAWIDSGAYPGALLWVEDFEGKTLYEHSWNGVGRQSEMTIASASKWLEAATLMTLVDEGKLDLDVPIRKYLPQLTGAKGDNTLRQLFAHTGNLNPLDLPREAAHHGINQLPDDLAGIPTDEKPGTRFWYGGTDLALGARIIELTEGKPWLLTFGEKIAAPCRMKQTVTGPDLWTFDRLTGGDHFPRSTAQDYMNFLQMIAHDGQFHGRKVLSPAAIREMQADQVRGASVKAGEFPESIGCGRYNGVYGLGEWRLAFDAAGEVAVLSSPAYTGFFPWIDKRHRLCGVFAAKAGWGAKIDAFHTAPKLFQLIERGFATASAAKVKALIVDGYSNHDWQRTTQLARGILERSGVCEVSVSTVPVDTNDPAYARWLPAFKDFDVVVQTCNDLGGKGPPWPGPARAAFEEFVRGGGGVFVLHSGNNAFADWPAYNQIIGLGWRSRDFGTALRIREDESVERIPPGEGAGTSHGARTDRVIHRLGDDPVHAGLPRAWKTPLVEVYTHARGPAENVTVLSWAEDPATLERWPIEWTVQYGAGRVYNSTFGHVWAGEADPVDMRCAGFQTIFVRAMQWLAKRPVTFPLPADFPTETATSLRP